MIASAALPGLPAAGEPPVCLRAACPTSQLTCQPHRAAAGAGRWAGPAAVVCPHQGHPRARLCLALLRTYAWHAALVFFAVCLPARRADTHAVQQCVRHDRLPAREGGGASHWCWNEHTWHPGSLAAADDLGRQVEAHHYCSHPSEEVRQCTLWDSDEAGECGVLRPHRLALQWGWGGQRQRLPVVTHGGFFACLARRGLGPPGACPRQAVGSPCFWLTRSCQLQVLD